MVHRKINSALFIATIVPLILLFLSSQYAIASQYCWTNNCNPKSPYSGGLQIDSAKFVWPEDLQYAQVFPVSRSGTH